MALENSVIHYGDVFGLGSPRDSPAAQLYFKPPGIFSSFSLTRFPAQLSEYTLCQKCGVELERQTSPNEATPGLAMAALQFELRPCNLPITALN